MIALTKEKREKLIESAKNIIAHDDWLWEKFSDIHASSDTIYLIKIALAALTTGAIGRVNVGAVSDNNEYPDAKVECIHPQADWDNFQDGFLLFTTPPVPEIKLPSINRYEKYLGTLAEEAWRDCIVEIKRLNGLDD